MPRNQADICAVANGVIDERRTLNTKTWFLAAGAVAGIFLGLYLFRLGGFAQLAIFSILYFAALSIMSAFAGHIMGRMSARQCLQAGAVFLGLVYLILLALGTSAPPLLIAFVGVLRGVGEGLFWPAIMRTELAVTTTESRHGYFGRSAWRSGITSVASPAFAGAVYFVVDYLNMGVQASSYLLIGSLVLLLLALIISAHNLPDIARTQFSLRDVGSGLASREWRANLWQYFFLGLWTSIFPVFATGLLLVAVQSESRVSFVVAAGALLSSFGGRLAGRYLHIRPSSQAVAAIATSVGLAGFAVDGGWLGVLCFAVLIRGAQPFAQNATQFRTFETIDRMGLPTSRTYHLMVESELALNVGRVASFVIALGALQIGADASARVVMFAAAFVPLVIALLQHRWQQSHTQAVAT